MLEPQTVTLPGASRVARDVRTRVPRCLLVEADRFDRSMVRYAADRGGIELDFVDAGTLAEARQSLSQEEFELVILDSRLPDGDALALAAELASSDRHSKMPVILLGVGNSDDLAIASRAAGCAAHRLKQDVSPAWLARAVSTALNSSGAGSALPEQVGDVVTLVPNTGPELARIRRLKPLASRLTALVSELRHMSGDPAADAALEELSELALMLWIDLDAAENAAGGGAQASG